MAAGGTRSPVCGPLSVSVRYAANVWSPRDARSFFSTSKKYLFICFNNNIVKSSDFRRACSVSVRRRRRRRVRVNSMDWLNERFSNDCRYETGWLCAFACRVRARRRPLFFPVVRRARARGGVATRRPRGRDVMRRRRPAGVFALLAAPPVPDPFPPRSFPASATSGRVRTPPLPTRRQPTLVCRGTQDRGDPPRHPSFSRTVRPSLKDRPVDHVIFFPLENKKINRNVK